MNRTGLCGPNRFLFKLRPPERSTQEATVTATSVCLTFDSEHSCDNVEKSQGLGLEEDVRKIIYIYTIIYKYHII